MRLLPLLSVCLASVLPTLKGQGLPDPFGSPSVSTLSKKPQVLHFGRTDEQLFEIYSKCTAGTNIDFSLSDEEVRVLEKYKKSCLEFIKSEPDLPIILVDYLDRRISGKGFEINSASSGALIGVLRALALRPDVDVKVVQRYTRLATELWEKQQRANESWDKGEQKLPISTTEATLSDVFVVGLPGLIGSYPTREGEDYVIKILEHPVGPKQHFNVLEKLAAAGAAGKSGTARCLPGMEQTSEEFKQVLEHQKKFGNSESSQDVQAIEAHLKNLRERMTQTQRGTH